MEDESRAVPPIPEVVLVRAEGCGGQSRPRTVLHQTSKCSFIPAWEAGEGVRPCPVGRRPRGRSSSPLPLYGRGCRRSEVNSPEGSPPPPAALQGRPGGECRTPALPGPGAGASLTATVG